MRANYFNILVALFLLTGCTEKIDFELQNEENERVVVEGYFTDEVKNHLIKLTKSGGYYDNLPPTPISNATVSITNGTDVWPLNENPAGSGDYYTENVGGTIGQIHTLNIDYDGKQYEASELMNSVAELEMIEVYLEEEEDFDEADPFYNYVVYAWTADPVNVQNYYRWNVLKNGVLYNDSLTNYDYGGDFLWDGTVLVEFELYFLDDDDFQAGDTVTIEQMSITEMANEAYLGMSLETDFDGPFGSAPSNVVTNLSEGAIGYFAVCASSKASYVIDE